MTIATSFTFSTRVRGSVGENRPRVEAALRAEGFGILTEIDVQATMRAKLGIEQAPYLILGACNPPLAHRAIEADPSVGALLPCNVVLREDGPDTIVEALDPMAALGIVQVPSIQAVAEEARARLVRAIAPSSRVDHSLPHRTASRRRPHPTLEHWSPPWLSRPPASPSMARASASSVPPEAAARSSSTTVSATPGCAPPSSSRWPSPGAPRWTSSPSCARSARTSPAIGPGLRDAAG